MSKKRTSAELNNEDSDGVSRQEDNAKRGKFASDTTLQDIPTKILQCILVKAITMEVKNTKLAKSVWKEKADLVISRLGSVSSQWTNVLKTNEFQMELHQALDDIVQEKFRMEQVQELCLDCYALSIATLKDDIFLLCSRTESNDPDDDGSNDPDNNGSNDPDNNGSNDPDNNGSNDPDNNGSNDPDNNGSNDPDNNGSNDPDNNGSNDPDNNEFNDLDNNEFNDLDIATSATSTVYNITIYDRNNLEEVKAVIELPAGLFLGTIAACNVSNCVYILKVNVVSQSAAVLRITKDEDQKFNIQPWISDLSWEVSSISVSDEGSVILSSTPGKRHVGPHLVGVYGPNGVLQQEVSMPENVYGSKCFDSCVIRRPNGNLVLASANKQSGTRRVDVTEVDTNGIIQRQYKSPLAPENGVVFMSFADASGRILIHDMYNGIELLDSELNLLALTGPQTDQDDELYFNGFNLNRERNEGMGICAVDYDLSVLRIFSFKEE